MFEMFLLTWKPLMDPAHGPGGGATGRLWVQSHTTDFAFFIGVQHQQLDSEAEVEFCDLHDVTLGGTLAFLCIFPHKQELQVHSALAAAKNSRDNASVGVLLHSPRLYIWQLAGFFQPEGTEAALSPIHLVSL